MRWLWRQLFPIQSIRREAFAKHVEGFFVNWQMMDSCAVRFQGHCLWIHGGFSQFTDHGDCAPLLDGLKRWERSILWDELKKEQRRRAFQFIDGDWRNPKTKVA